MYNIFKFLPKEITVILTAILPVIELRGAIPIGISLGISPIYSTILSFIGSLIPVPIILFTIRPIFNYLKKTKLFKEKVDKITDHFINKGKKIQDYGFWGLIIFVSIPLPGTGVWSGTIIAALLDMSFKRAFPAILIGNLNAAIIVLLLSKGAIKVFF